MRQRIMATIVTTGLIAVASVFGVRAFQSWNSLNEQSKIRVESPQQRAGQTMKIVPATADGPSGGSFIGTGDGGNGYYAK